MHMYDIDQSDIPESRTICTSRLTFINSLYRSRAGSHFYGTEYEIWTDFGLVGNTEKKNWGPNFFMFSWAKRTLKSGIISVL